jgi:hypothetical protein
MGDYIKSSPHDLKPPEEHLTIKWKDKYGDRPIWIGKTKVGCECIDHPILNDERISKLDVMCVKCGLSAEHRFPSEYVRLNMANRKDLRKQK